MAQDEPTIQVWRQRLTDAKSLLAEVKAIDGDGDKSLTFKEFLRRALAKHQEQHAQDADPFKQVREDIAIVKGLWKNDPPPYSPEWNTAQQAKGRLLELLGNDVPTEINNALRMTANRAADTDRREEEARAEARRTTGEKADAAKERSGMADKLIAALPPAQRNNPDVLKMIRQMTDTPGREEVVEKPDPAALAIKKELRTIQSTLAPYAVNLGTKPLNLNDVEEQLNAMAQQRSGQTPGRN